MCFLKYKNLLNYLKKEFDVPISITKHKIKEEIRKSSIPLDIKSKLIFNEVSQEMGLICPEYSTIRSQIIKSINKIILIFRFYFIPLSTLHTLKFINININEYY